MPQTGPRSASGKAASSRNARKHGLLSLSPVILEIDEDPGEWKRHSLAIIEHLAPEGYLEVVFAERIANLLWRIKRLERYEREITVVRLHDIPDDMSVAAQYDKTLGIPIEKSITLERVEKLMSRRIIPDTDTLTNVMRYESHLHRHCLQTLHELEAMQTRRKGGVSPLARLDITGAPGG